MKKITKKLTLNKETISTLDSKNLNSVKGGYSGVQPTCIWIQCATLPRTPCYAIATEEGWDC